MKYIIILIALISVNHITLAQRNAINHAIKKGRKKAEPYVAIFEPAVVPQKVEKYCKRKDIYINKTFTRKEFLFGSNQELVTGIYFIPNTEIEKYNIEIKEKEIEKKIEKEKIEKERNFKIANLKAQFSSPKSVIIFCNDELTVSYEIDNEDIIFRSNKPITIYADKELYGYLRLKEDHYMGTGSNLKLSISDFLFKQSNYINVMIMNLNEKPNYSIPQLNHPEDGTFYSNVEYKISEYGYKIELSKFYISCFEKYKIDEQKKQDAIQESIDNGSFTGFARYNYSNGYYYEGNWVKGEKEGDGTFSDGTFIMKGKWENDMRNGVYQITKRGIFSNEYLGTVEYKDDIEIKRDIKDNSSSNIINTNPITDNNKNDELKNDACNGNFTLISYKKGDYNSYDKCYLIEYSDEISGKLFYSEKCGKYYVDWISYNVYYSNIEFALKALYVYKKYACRMKGEVDCN